VVAGPNLAPMLRRRNAHYIANQRAMEESGDMALPARTETVSQTDKDEGVIYGAVMLS